MGLIRNKAEHSLRCLVAVLSSPVMDLGQFSAELQRVYGRSTLGEGGYFSDSIIERGFWIWDSDAGKVRKVLPCRPFGSCCRPVSCQAVARRYKNSFYICQRVGL